MYYSFVDKEKFLKSSSITSYQVEKLTETMSTLFDLVNVLKDDEIIDFLRVKSYLGTLYNHGILNNLQYQINGLRTAYFDSIDRLLHPEKYEKKTK